MSSISAADPWGGRAMTPARHDWPGSHSTSLRSFLATCFQMWMAPAAKPWMYSLDLMSFSSFRTRRRDFVVSYDGELNWCAAYG